MNSKTKSTLLLVFLTITLIICSTLVLAFSFKKSESNVVYGEGSGTESDPYLIGTKAELEAFKSAVKTNRSACARLTNDIDLGSTSFDPILTEWEYEGVFDGAGHTINGFKGWCFFNTSYRRSIRS